MINPATHSKTIHWGVSFFFQEYTLEKTILGSRDSRKSDYKSQLLPINKLLLHFSPPDLGQTVKRKNRKSRG